VKNVVLVLLKDGFVALRKSFTDEESMMKYVENSKDNRLSSDDYVMELEYANSL